MNVAAIEQRMSAVAEQIQNFCEWIRQRDGEAKRCQSVSGQATTDKLTPTGHRGTVDK